MAFFRQDYVVVIKMCFTREIQNEFQRWRGEMINIKKIKNKEEERRRKKKKIVPHTC
jgi:hypothetical protein